MTPEARDRVKDLLVNASQLVIMNENDPVELYTEASTKSIGGVLIQEQNEGEPPQFHFSYLVGLNNEIRGHGYAFVFCILLI